MHHLSQLCHKLYKMRLNLVLYLGILLVDLLVGGCIILLNCVLRIDDDEACSLATGGTMGSVVILTVVMVICPLYMTKWSICEIVDSIRDVIKRRLKLFRPQPYKHKELLLETQQLIAAKANKTNGFISLDENKNAIILPDSSVSLVPAGKGPVRGVFNTTSHTKSSRSDDNAKYTEVNET